MSPRFFNVPLGIQRHGTTIIVIIRVTHNVSHRPKIEPRLMAWQVSTLLTPPHLSPSYTFCFRVRTHVHHPYPCPSFWIPPCNDILSDTWWFRPYLVTLYTKSVKIASVWRFYHLCPLWKGYYTFPSAYGNRLTDAEIRTRTCVAYTLQGNGFLPLTDLGSRLANMAYFGDGFDYLIKVQQ